MAAFRFRLATLLRLREADRDDRRAQLADAQRAEEIVRQRVGEIEREIEQTREAGRRRTQPGQVNVDQMLELQRYEIQLQTESAATERQRALIAEEVERRRERLTAADREVRILERLRETQQEQHQADERRTEQRLFDEIAGRTVPAELRE